MVPVIWRYKPRLEKVSEKIQNGERMQMKWRKHFADSFGIRINNNNKKKELSNHRDRI